MQELEKILEEIRKAFEENTRNIVDEDECHHFVVDVCTATYLVNKIIRKHTKDNTDGKNDNNGWISVEERLPEEKKSVLVQWEKYDRHLNITLTYLDVMWLEDEESVVFKTINGIPNGRVIAWRPLPETYHQEGSDNHDGE